MKRIVVVLLTIILLVLCLSCSKESPVSIKKDGCINPLSWGINVENAKMALSDRHIQYAQTVSQEEREVIRFEARLFDAQATIDLKFSSLWPDSVANGLYLNEITVVFAQADIAQIADQLKNQWGEQATQEPVYVNYDGIERVEMRDMTLEKGHYVWRSEKSILDEFDENKLIEIIGLSQEELNERSLVKRLYDSSLFKATLQQMDNNDCYLDVNGYYAALVDLKK